MGGCCVDDDHDSPVEKIDIVPEKRKCTDWFCCVIYILFIAFIIFAGIWGFSKGNLKNIAQPYDVDSNACGRGALKDFPYLFFNEFVTNYKNVKGTVCVKECLSDPSKNYACYPNSSITNCNQIKYYKAKTYFHRFCLADIVSKSKKSVALAQNELISGTM